MFRVRIYQDQNRAQNRTRHGPGVPAPMFVVRRDLRLRRAVQPHLQALQIEPSLAPGIISRTEPIPRSELTA